MGQRIKARYSVSRVWDTARDKEKTPLPAQHSGMDGIDRRKIDDLTLDRDVQRTIKEIWE